jgi:hypothetical protein
MLRTLECRRTASPLATYHSIDAYLVSYRDPAISTAYHPWASSSAAQGG